MLVMNCTALPPLPVLIAVVVCVFHFEGWSAYSFVPRDFRSQAVSWRSTNAIVRDDSMPTTSDEKNDELLAQKRKLLSLLGPKKFKDPVLADPITKEGITITSSNGVCMIGDSVGNRASFSIKSPTSTFKGSAGTYLDLLEPAVEEIETTMSSDGDSSSLNLLKAVMRQAVPLFPPNLRGPLSPFFTNGEDKYVPMRDLFTNPSVSFAYERGWRQGFAAAGFPGSDTEAEMAMEYFAPVVARANPSSVIVDMSCATGLFTRRFAKAGKYGRVLGCDYSPSMLSEARRRINADPELREMSSSTSLDLVRLDVGQIPMKSRAVDCLHAGAAMHCWPDLNAAVLEIHRVLKPGGRYFATTFLSSYFRSLSEMDGQAGATPSQQAFQYFDSIDVLKDLMIRGGFDEEKIMIEVLGAACVVIRAEK